MKRIVTMQDVSCVGKCSLTVALPVISAMRHIVFSEFDSVFRFELEPSLLPALAKLTEIYAAHCFGFRSRLLDFFAAATAPL